MRLMNEFLAPLRQCIGPSGYAPSAMDSGQIWFVPLNLHSKRAVIFRLIGLTRLQDLRLESKKYAQYCPSVEFQLCRRVVLAG